MDPVTIALLATPLVALSFGVWLGWKIGDGSRQVLQMELDETKAKLVESEKARNRTVEAADVIVKTEQSIDKANSAATPSERRKLLLSGDSANQAHPTSGTPPK